MDLTYQIQFYSFWHAGSGLSGGVVVDANVIKTKEGLPYLPGKTLKGLLRDSAEILLSTRTDLITTDFIKEVFGSAHEEVGTECHFTNAYLSQNLREKILAQNLTGQLYQEIASTAIDDKGQAVEHSLREMQVSVPLILYAQAIAFPEKESYKNQFEYCLKFIKQMGAKRHRGLGRCDFTLV